MRLRIAAAILVAQGLCAMAVLGADITSGSLQIQGMSLEVDLGQRSRLCGRNVR